MSSPRSVRPEDHAAPHPIYAVWELTLRCDQACRHCGSRAGRARQAELDTVGALQVVRQLAEAGVREVTLIGGEAYLREDWLQIIEAITGQGMRCSLVSGGRSLTPERLARAKAAGVYSISISIDGLRPTHDGLRAAPRSWESALAAVDAVVEAGVIATVNTQINRENTGELEALAEVLLAHQVRVWQLQLTTPMGRAADQARLVLQPWDLLDLFPRLAALADHCQGRGMRLMAANNLGYYGPHEARLRAGGHWTGCPAGRFSLGIQSDGALKGCSSLPSDPYAGDDLAEHTLADALDGEAIRLVRERTVDHLWGYCAECYYGPMCLGGCPWTAHTFMGRPGNQPYCHHRALELKERGLRERLEPVAPAPGRSFDYGRWELVQEPWEG